MSATADAPDRLVFSAVNVFAPELVQHLLGDAEGLQRGGGAAVGRGLQQHPLDLGLGAAVAAGPPGAGPPPRPWVSAGRRAPGVGGAGAAGPPPAGPAGPP